MKVMNDNTKKIWCVLINELSKDKNPPHHNCGFVGAKPFTLVDTP